MVQKSFADDVEFIENKIKEKHTACYISMKSQGVGSVIISNDVASLL
jgi:hypothetical protein